MTSSVGFKIAAVVLLIAGAALVVFGATAEVTVQPESRYVPYVGLVDAPRTVNFQLMLRALVMVLVGGFAFVSGCVLLVGSAMTAGAQAVADPATSAVETPAAQEAADAASSEPKIFGQSGWGALALFGGLIAAAVVALLVFVR